MFTCKPFRTIVLALATTTLAAANATDRDHIEVRGRILLTDGEMQGTV